MLNRIRFARIEDIMSYFSGSTVTIVGIRTTINIKPWYLLHFYLEYSTYIEVAELTHKH